MGITCTQEASQWIRPHYLREVEYLPIKEIDFTSAHGKKRKLDSQIKDAVDSEVPQDDEIMISERSMKVGTRSTNLSFYSYLTV